MPWRPDPHLPIEKLEPNLWRVEAAVGGLPLRRVMTAVKLQDGRGLIHSAVMMGDAAMDELVRWAKPGVLVVPNAFHRKDALAYKERFPSILVVCPKVARAKVSERVQVDASYEELELGDASVRFIPIDGIGEQERVMEVRSLDGVTLVFNDLLFNMPHAGGPRGFALRHILDSSGGPKVTRLGRTFLVRDRAAVRAELLRLSETPGLRRIIVSHHETITARPAEVLREVAERL